MSTALPRFINRELSWLEFNQRVLDEARDESVPLLERLKFLAISGSNLDEFFMVRVGGLHLLRQRGNVKPDPAGMTPDDQLSALNVRIRRMLDDQYACLSQRILPQLEQAGIRRLLPAALHERQRHYVEQFISNEICSVFTPIAIATRETLPLLSNHTLHMAIRLAPAPKTTEPRFAVIPFGVGSRRFITLPAEGGYSFMLLEDAITMFIDRFFPGETIEECVPFRISRNADMSVRDDLAADLMVELEEILDARKDSACVRLEISEASSQATRSFLEWILEVRHEDVYASPGPLDLAAFMQLTDLQGFETLKYEPWPPQPSPAIDMTASMFEVISQHDVLLCHPYESFEPVVRLLEEAANDPDVLAIKQTLYRTSRNSPIVEALRAAAERGKYVTAIVELKARFDEARNIEWARSLEQSGVQVIYGVKGLKTHAKVCVIVRREPQGIQRYVHFGTGNYNEVTARIYSDISYMTCAEELGADAVSFFNAVTGYSQPQRFRALEAAPIGMREKLLEMIEVETQRKQQGQKASIVAKMNSLVDPQIIDALYTASQAGVPIRLNIRGICCLRPGIEGLSENISVNSIVDRFLEHARIFYFHHGGDERVFIASADWMPRNLDRRVELMIPIEDPNSRRRLISILEAYFQDNTKARQLLPDGSYQLLQPKSKRKVIRSQELLYREACQALKQATQSRRTTFEPHVGRGKT